MPVRLGKYEILRRLAVGGMAEIYLARVSGISGFEKLVVVKRILPQLASNPEFVEMFLDEARIAATLHHSNIVQVYDAGSVDGQYFFSMEFLNGEDVSSILRALVAAGRMPKLETALAVVLGACAGLHYAHEKVGLDGQPLNIVHRDVSPQNVIVTFDGNVKLLDFGIAKASRRLSATRYGTLKGKIRYMSPEQCRGEAVDRRSDIFSVAIMLWELTTGRRLFAKSSEFDTLKTIVESDALPPSSVSPGYPPELERIVMKGLRRPRAERYQTAQELQFDLEEFARENKLSVSSIMLSRFMHELFGARLEAWQAAQDDDFTVAEYVGTVMEERAAAVDDDVPIVVEEAPAEAPPVAPAPAESTDPSVRPIAFGETVPLGPRKAPAAAAVRRPVSPLLVAIGAVLGLVLVFGGWALLGRGTPPAVKLPAASDAAAAVAGPAPVTAPPDAGPAPGAARALPAPPERPATLPRTRPVAVTVEPKRKKPVERPVAPDRKKAPPPRRDLDSPFPP